MEANRQPMVSTFSRPVNRNQVNRTTPNSRQFPNNSYIPLTQLLPHSPSMKLTKLWQVEMNPWLASSPDFQSFRTDRRSIMHPLCVVELFENSSLRNETVHCLTIFSPRSLVKHKILDTSSDRFTRATKRRWSLSFRFNY